MGRPRMSSQPTAHDAASEAMHKVGFGNFASLAGVDAVLAELGIPADTDPRRIEAGLAIIDYIDSGAPGSLDAVFASPNGWTGRQVVNLAWSTRESEDVVNCRIPTRREASDA